jgi:hypothetical protein
MKRPPGKQSVAECATECIARAEAVEDVDRERRHLDALVARAGENAPGPSLDHGQVDAVLEQRIRGAAGLVLADRSQALVQVADGNRCLAEYLLYLLSRGLSRRPEHRPVVKVEDGVLPPIAGIERYAVGRTARLGRQSGTGDPEHAGRSNRVEVEIARFELQVSRQRRSPVEVEGEVVRRKDLAERDLREHALDGSDVTVVDAELSEGVAQVTTERVGAGCRHDRGMASVPCRRDCDVGGRAAHELAEFRDLIESDTSLQRIHVDGDPADRQDVIFVADGCWRRSISPYRERRCVHRRTSSTRTSRCSSRLIAAASAT